MTPEQIKQWAQESGFVNSKIFGPLVAGRPVGDLLERFAALVAAHEREACAQVCDAKAHEIRLWCNESNVIACAAAIRARGTP